jgi:hypothetical protein
MASTQPPKTAEVTGTTVWPIAGTAPARNSNGDTTAAIPIRPSDWRTLRSTPRLTGSSSSGTSPNSRSTDSEILS